MKDMTIMELKKVSNISASIILDVITLFVIVMNLLYLQLTEKKREL